MRRPAFTLLELVVAATLTSILMAVVFLTLRSSFAETRFGDTRDAERPYVQLLREQIRRDVENSRGISTSRGRLDLSGFLATDPEQLMPTLSEARVVYRVDRKGGRNVLTRTELPSVDRDEVRTDVIWSGVETFDVQANSSSDGDNIGSTGVVEPATGGLSPTPTAVRITLIGDRGQTLMIETIRHHREG